MNSSNEPKPGIDPVGGLLMPLLPKRMQEHPKTMILLPCVLLLGGGTFTLFCSLEDENKQRVLTFFWDPVKSFFGTSYSIHGVLFWALFIWSALSTYWFWCFKRSMPAGLPEKPHTEWESVTAKCLLLEQQLSVANTERDRLRAQMAVLTKGVKPPQKEKKNMTALIPMNIRYLCVFSRIPTLHEAN